MFKSEQSSIILYFCDTIMPTIKECRHTRAPLQIALGCDLEELFSHMPCTVTVEREELGTKSLISRFGNWVYSVSVIAH